MGQQEERKPQTQLMTNSHPSVSQPGIPVPKSSEQFPVGTLSTYPFCRE